MFQKIIDEPQILKLFFTQFQNLIKYNQFQY